MPIINKQTQPILLEALEDLMYKVSLELESMKGGPMTHERKALTEKQHLIEKLQHEISVS